MTGQFETRKKKDFLFQTFYFQEFLQKQLVFSVYQKREKKNKIKGKLHEKFTILLKVN